MVLIDFPPIVVIRENKQFCLFKGLFTDNLYLTSVLVF